MKILSTLVIIAGVIAVPLTAQAACMSYATLVPRDDTICFAKNLDQYVCRYNSNRQYYYFHKIQKLTLRSSLNSGSCDNIDRSNLKPDGPPYGARIK